jgi:uncharacterized membrane protein YjfL (UPF0719 family)
MMKVFGNVIEMFVYSAVYMIIVLVSVKIIGAIFTADFEKKISDENNIALSIICACILIGIALLVAAVIR